MVGVIKQREWTEAKLREQGFDRYERRKEVIMVRQLLETEAPKVIVTSSGDTLIAQTGDMICYEPGDHILPTLDDYNHWPVSPQIFRQTYRVWDERDWHPSASQKHLMQMGCQPYYKIAEVWAKKLSQSTYLQSLEQEKPELVKRGHYVVIGAKGEPYSMGETTFQRRYYKGRLVALLKHVRQLFQAKDKGENHGQVSRNHD